MTRHAIRLAGQAPRHMILSFKSQIANRKFPQGLFYRASVFYLLLRDNEDQLAVLVPGQQHHPL